MRRGSLIMFRSAKYKKKLGTAALIKIMPQWKIIYGSIIVILVAMLLATHTILAGPIIERENVNAKQDENNSTADDNNGSLQDAKLSSRHSVNKRSFYDIHCKGIYDKSIFARVDQICEDCYNLFREPKLHTLCRQSCFTTEYFKGCVDVLMLTDELENIQQWVRVLNGLGV